MPNKQRIKLTYFFFIFIFFIISLKIFYLQVFRSDFFKGLAQNQHYRLLRISGKRGKIFDRSKRVLASDISRYSIFADPALISKKEQTAKKLSQDLDLSEQDLLLRLKKDKRFVWVKRKVSWEDKERIKSLDLPGVQFIREEKRFYLHDDLAASVLGIVGIDNRGLEGLEAFYDSYLQGKDGFIRVLQDSARKEIILSPQAIIPQEGADIELNLDAQIQYWTEKYLKETIKTYQAKSGSAVVMDALGGQILALANYPAFDPNDLESVTQAAMRNRAIADIFEPGSVFKVVTLIAAIDEKKFSDEDKIFCEDGKFKIPGTILNDWRPYGELSFKEVFMKSSNIGVAKIATSLEPEVFDRYVRKLGFGKPSGIDLSGETKGLVKPLSQWSNTSPYIMPIGQEIGVNLLQLARVFAVVVNGGYLVKPEVVKSICSRGFCKQIRPVRKKVLSSSTAKRAKEILIEVVEKGTGKLAIVEGIKIGGKTGTAQKYDPKIRRYSPSKYRATFVGFIADLKQPLVIGVTVDEPRKSHFGGVVAAPVFRKIAQELIKYMEIDEAKKPLP
jgi:cell division protein FtsI (penicillin-binding protein 3)